MIKIPSDLPADERLTAEFLAKTLEDLIVAANNMGFVLTVRENGEEFPPDLEDMRLKRV